MVVEVVVAEVLVGGGVEAVEEIRYQHAGAVVVLSRGIEMICMKIVM